MNPERLLLTSPAETAPQLPCPMTCCERLPLAIGAARTHCGVVAVLARCPECETQEWRIQGSSDYYALPAEHLAPAAEHPEPLPDWTTIGARDLDDHVRAETVSWFAGKPYDSRTFREAMRLIDHLGIDWSGLWPEVDARGLLTGRIVGDEDGFAGVDDEVMVLISSLPRDERRRIAREDTDGTWDGYAHLIGQRSRPVPPPPGGINSAARKQQHPARVEPARN